MSELLVKKKINSGISKNKIMVIFFVVVVLFAGIIAFFAQNEHDKRIRDNFGKGAVTDMVTHEDSNNIVINNNINPALRETKQEPPKVNQLYLPPLVATEQSNTPHIDTEKPIQQQHNDITINMTDSSYKQQNGQPEKEKFLEAQATSDYNLAKVNSPLSKYELKAGSLIPAILKYSINSDLPSQTITAYVRENVFDTVTGRHLLIPRGATLVGRYDSGVTYGQERLLVAWNRLIYPNGKSYNFVHGFTGADKMGRSGFDGDVNQHYVRLFGASFVMGVITGAITYASGANQTSGANPTVAQSLAMGVGQQAGQTGVQITQKNLNIQPTIEVEAGKKFNVLISSDCILR